MTMIAVGTYLRTLRDAAKPKITQRDAGLACGVHEHTIREYEAGRLTPSAEVMAKLIDCVHGSPVQVHVLLKDDKATSDDGLAFAEVWLRGGTVITPNVLGGTPQERAYHVYQLLNQLTADELRRLTALLLNR